MMNADGAIVRSETPAQSWARALSNVAPLKHQPTATLPSRLDELARRFTSKPALISENGPISYDELATQKRRVARWALQHGFGADVTIGLLMEGGPAYIAAWLGLTEIGAVVALLNDGLRGSALTHAIHCSQARCVIVDEAHIPAINTALALLPTTIEVILFRSDHLYDGTDGARILDYWAFDGAPLLPAERPSVLSAATALLLFTSGTTGLPKAARISHYRILEWGLWFAGMMNTSPTDRLYNCLPLFHSTGGIAAIGGILLNGGSVVLRRRFSARRFWDDVADEHCTIFLYIGELCRYLLRQPPHLKELTHHLRLCCGNGLREEVWRHFQDRFKIPRILEFYASTEGNVSLYNCEGKPGAVGRIPSILKHRFPVALVACEPETGTIHRSGDGRCTPCQIDQVGEALGLITAVGSPEPTAFDGYTDPVATEQKILRNVFSPGDAWFRTGDLMRLDGAGYFSFVDRLGDTFRWKGENVSTTQVADALSEYPGVIQAVVYGVEVVGEDGRAGMAAVIVEDYFDLGGLPTFLAKHLPPYAHPIYLRLRGFVETTATFKPIKVQLIKEGYDVTKVLDPLYRLDHVTMCFHKLQPGAPE
jgi:fatty-acyl-CoA synthase